jgi:hypothetical protein
MILFWYLSKCIAVTVSIVDEANGRVTSVTQFLNKREVLDADRAVEVGNPFVGRGVCEKLASAMTRIED